MTAIVDGQLDLLDLIEADNGLTAVEQRYYDALTCLRDAVPEALEVVIRLCDWKSADKRGAGASGRWCYTVANRGVYFDTRDRWNPEARPEHLVTWNELTDLLADHPLRPGVIAWAEALAELDSWKDRFRPYELWPDPHRWHPSYIESDRSRPGYEARMQAWADCYQILTDTQNHLTGDSS